MKITRFDTRTLRDELVAEVDGAITLELSNGARFSLLERHIPVPGQPYVLTIHLPDGRLIVEPRAANAVLLRIER